MITIGNVVTLRGETVAMTVTEDYGDSCKVVWFDVEGKLLHATFFKKALEKVE